MNKEKKYTTKFFGLPCQSGRLGTSVFGLILVLLIIQLTSCAQNSNKEKPSKIYTIAFYNVENLFDTIDNPKTRDEEFTPTGRKKWNTEKYLTKLNHLSKVISGIDKELPLIVGLCEIENKTVVEDLIKTKFLKKGKYKIVHDESPDFRGIDNALIYKKKGFDYLYHKAIPVKLKDNSRFITRDILYVKGLIKKDTFHIFVNHWPSRRGGQAKSEHKRIQAAKTLKLIVDSIYNVNPESNIIIMGDFNDEPNDKSIQELTKSENLTNLTAKYTKKGEGTYHYWKTKEWNKLDQIIISSKFHASKANSIKVEYQIFKPNWILIKEGNEMVPSKTFAKGYNGGYSDHLPVYIQLLFCK